MYVNAIAYHAMLMGKSRVLVRYVETRMEDVHPACSFFHGSVLRRFRLG